MQLNNPLLLSQGVRAAVHQPSKGIACQDRGIMNDSEFTSQFTAAPRMRSDAGFREIITIFIQNCKNQFFNIPITQPQPSNKNLTNTPRLLLAQQRGEDVQHAFGP